MNNKKNNPLPAILMTLIIISLLVIVYFQWNKNQYFENELARLETEWLDKFDQQKGDIQNLALNYQSLDENLKRFQQESLNKNLLMQEELSNLEQGLKDSSRKLAVLRDNQKKQMVQITPEPTLSPVVYKIVESEKENDEEIYPFSDTKMSKLYKEARDLYNNNDFPQAKTRLLDLVKLEPPFWSAKLYYCLASYNESPVKTAGDINIHRLLDQFPDDFNKIDEVYKLKSKIYLENGLYSQGLEYGQKSLNINPDDIEFRLFLSRFASIYKDYASVVFLLDSPLLSNYQKPEGFIKLAQAYEGLSNETSALLNYQKAIDLKTTNKEAYEKAGFIYLNKGDKSKAIKVFEQSLPFEPDSDVLLALGELYLSENKKNAAIKTFNSLLTKYKSTPQAAKAQSYLNSLQEG